ncbi:MAG: hypothetical protein P8R54_22165 [Myxococcota bacterium]|nr:hypothetical protein [Myxococcota bacterium]
MLAWIGVIAALCLILLSLAHATWRLQIAPTPSSPDARARIAALVATQLAADGCDAPTIFELGAGWGGLAARLARMPASATPCVRGYERSVVPYVVSRVFRQRAPGLTFHRHDITDAIAEVRAGDVLVCYLCPEQMRRISAALRARLGDDPVAVTLISLSFALPGFSPAETQILPSLYRARLYRYAVSPGEPQVPLS